MADKSEAYKTGKMILRQKHVAERIILFYTSRYSISKTESSTRDLK